MHHSPQFFRHAVAEAVLGGRLQRDLRPRWREALLNFDAVIIGGGNLLSDVDLNFPLKLDAVMQEVRAARVPYGIFGVGVSDNWSQKGRALFRRAFLQGENYFASVREARSAKIWQRELRPIGLKDARVVHDPGLLAALHFPRADRGGRTAPVVGLGLTHPIALKYHSHERARSSKEQANWYVAFARACLARGWSIAVFTNGSPEDEAYLAELRPRLSSLAPAGRISFMPRFHNPSQLAGFVSTLDLLMAHRLHANIAAYSYAVPHIGFSWDVKLESFLAQVGRPQCICRVGVDPVDTVVELAAHELSVGVDSVRHRAVLSEARDDVAKLAEAIRSAVLARREPRCESLAEIAT
jgi:polysaccharide pyruvyl transferase WcaK-like protein